VPPAGRPALACLARLLTVLAVDARAVPCSLLCLLFVFLSSLLFLWVAGVLLRLLISLLSCWVLSGFLVVGLVWVRRSLITTFRLLIPRIFDVVVEEGGHRAAGAVTPFLEGGRDGLFG